MREICKKQKQILFAISRFSDYVAPAGALFKLDPKYLQAFKATQMGCVYVTYLRL